MDEARVFSAREIKRGQKASFEREIVEQDVETFARLSGDYNPLHTNAAYAQQTNYGGRIVHGAFQVGLASTMAGMYLPGRNVVVGSMRSRFPASLYFPSKVLVQGEIISWMPQAATGILRVRVVEISQSVITAEIEVAFSLHEARPLASAEERLPVSGESGLPVIVITGAAGGVGLQLLQRLAASYQVIALVRSRGPAIEQLASDTVEIVEADLTWDDWEGALSAALHGRPLYGIVHAAWPGMPQGGLLGLDAAIIAQQVEFGSLVTIRLARLLAEHARGSGRMVVLGSTAATLKPAMQLGAYSLGKAAMEHAVRLIAPELAGKGILINAVLPSFMALGMNSAKTRQVVLTETARVPLGRLCGPEDIAGAVEYLLSPNASFITGQVLPLTGGQLS